MTGRNRVMAALLALLLGGVGVHKFYLGKIGQGVLYLLFCWTFVPAIIGFIEGLVYLTKTDEQFEREYGDGTKNTTEPRTDMPRLLADERTCPFCAETIKVAATKCRHCGSDLQAKMAAGSA